jgi:hypothetical protein
MPLLSSSIKRVATHADTLEELCALWEQPVVQPPLWWDRYNHILSTERANSLTQHLLGYGRMKTTIRALKAARSGQLTRWEGPIDLGLRLPQDAVIVQPYSKRGPVVVSGASGLAIKIVNSHQDLNNEITALDIAKRNNLSHHTQELVEHGNTSKGAQWMATRIAPNTRYKMSKSLPIFSSRWKRWLNKEGLPFLCSYYQASGPEYLSTETLIAHATSTLNSHVGPDAGILIRFISTLSSNKESDCMAVVRVHGDLDPAHVHQSSDGWKLIDWGESLRNLICYDLFKDHLHNSAPSQVHFWRWLTGQLPAESTPASVRNSIDLFTSLYKSNFDSNFDKKHLNKYVLLSVAINTKSHLGRDNFRHIAPLLNRHIL